MLDSSRSMFWLLVVCYSGLRRLMAEEFEALGIEFAERSKRTVECIEIYKRCWSDDFVSFDGDYYSFNDISMDPKPLQEPRPPIIYGGVSPLGAKRAHAFATVSIPCSWIRLLTLTVRSCRHNQRRVKRPGSSHLRIHHDGGYDNACIRPNTG